MTPDKNIQDIMEKSVKLLCQELGKYYHQIFHVKYNMDSMNDWDEEKSIFVQRMMMAVHMELVMAGLIK